MSMYLATIAVPCARVLYISGLVLFTELIRRYSHTAFFNQEGGDWGLCEVVLFSDDSLISALREQQPLFTVLEKGESGNQAIVVGSVCASLHAAVEGKEAFLAQLADAQTEIVSLTHYRKRLLSGGGTRQSGHHQCPYPT